MEGTISTAYTFGLRLARTVEETRERIEPVLRAEGFGILTEIDVAATLKARLGVDMAPYRILGVCNPPLAHRAIAAETSAGALLPCNVVLRADGPGTVVEFLDPAAAMIVSGSSEIRVLAVEARERLLRVAAALEAR